MRRRDFLLPQSKLHGILVSTTPKGRRKLRMEKTALGKYGYLWITLIFFLFSLLGQWVFAWSAYVQEQQSLGLSINISEYAAQTLEKLFENWQSEFLQLIWQVAGLSFLLYAGSPQSKEGDERKEEKIDRLITLLDPKQGREIIEKINKKFPS